MPSAGLRERRNASIRKLLWICIVVASLGTVLARLRIDVMSVLTLRKRYGAGRLSERTSERRAMNSREFKHICGKDLSPCHAKLGLCSTARVSGFSQVAQGEYHRQTNALNAVGTIGVGRYTARLVGTSSLGA
jgi:hypothetical protein